MDLTTGGVICIVLLLILMGTGLQIGLSFILSAFVVGALVLGIDSSLSLLGQVCYNTIASPTWACIPLFVLMGSFGAKGGFARRAYLGINALTGRIPGSLGVATCYGCAAFGAISGSSLATTAIFGKLALPEMDKLHYDKTFATACIASAGTFASMIPPSTMMIVYGLFTQQSIGKLFAAGIIPGLITATVYSISIIYRCKKNPRLAPSLTSEEKTLALQTRAKAIWGIWPVALISFVVLGGLYSGLFTPTEAAAVGSIVTLAMGFYLGDIRRLDILITSMKEAANTTAMIFLINIGALFYSRILSVTRLPIDLMTLLQSLDIPRFGILLGVILILFILGMIMVPIGIYALTLPIMFPMMVNLGYDPFWFAVVCLKLTEIGAVTPPVGLNIYAIKGVLPEGYNISMEQIFAGIWPFVICDLIVLTIIIAFPQIATWLPSFVG